jgi:hypothetical protein
MGKKHAGAEGRDVPRRKGVREGLAGANVAAGVVEVELKQAK